MCSGARETRRQGPSVPFNCMRKIADTKVYERVATVFYLGSKVNILYDLCLMAMLAAVSLIINLSR